MSSAALQSAMEQHMHGLSDDDRYTVTALCALNHVAMICGHCASEASALGASILSTTPSLLAIGMEAILHGRSEADVEALMDVAAKIGALQDVSQTIH